MTYLFEKIITVIVCFVDIDKIWVWVSNWETAIVIAVIAPVATIMQVIYNRKHNSLSVRPFLATSVEAFYEHNEEIRMECRKFKITNKGIGPAIITDIKLFFNGDRILYNNHEDFENALREKILNNSIKVDIGLESTSIAPRSVIAIGEEEMMWSIKFDSKIERSKIVDNFDNIKIRIEYESMYKEKIHPPIDTRIERKFS